MTDYLLYVAVALVLLGLGFMLGCLWFVDEMECWLKRYK